MPRVVLYTQANCATCPQVARWLRERGVAYTAKDVGTDPAAMAEFLTLGYLTTPVTVVDDTAVPGFQPQRLARLLAAAQHGPAI
jgi:glutaredoxin 3